MCTVAKRSPWQLAHTVDLMTKLPSVITIPCDSLSRVSWRACANCTAPKTLVGVNAESIVSKCLAWPDISFLGLLAGQEEWKPARFERNDLANGSPRHKTWHIKRLRKPGIPVATFLPDLERLPQSDEGGRLLQCED